MFVYERVIIIFENFLRGNIYFMSWHDLCFICERCDAYHVSPSTNFKHLCCGWVSCKKLHEDARTSAPRRQEEPRNLSLTYLFIPHCRFPDPPYPSYTQPATTLWIKYLVRVLFCLETKAGSVLDIFQGWRIVPHNALPGEIYQPSEPMEWQISSAPANTHVCIYVMCAWCVFQERWVIIKKCVFASVFMKYWGVNFLVLVYYISKLIWSMRKGWGS